MASPDQSPKPPHPAEETGGPATFGVPQGPGDWVRVVRLVALVAIAAYVVLFFLANTESVSIDFLFGQASLPLIVVLVVVFLLGWAWGGLFSTVRRRRTARRARDQPKKH